MKIFKILIIFPILLSLLGCSKQKGTKVIVHIAQETCFFGNCHVDTKYLEAYEQERDGDLCKYYFPDDDSTSWHKCDGKSDN